MKKLFALTFMLMMCFTSYGKQIKVYQNNGKLEFSLTVGNFLDSRLSYRSDFPKFPDCDYSVPSDVRVIGEIIAIDDSFITIIDPHFMGYFSDDEYYTRGEPNQIDGELKVRPEEIKSLTFSTELDLTAGASVGLGMIGLALSPIVSLGWGTGSFRTERFLRWVIVNGSIIIVGTIVHAIAKPGEYRFREFNGQPYFRKHKQATLRIE